MSYHSSPLGFSFSAEGSASIGTKPTASATSTSTSSTPYIPHFLKPVYDAVAAREAAAKAAAAKAKAAASKAASAKASAPTAPSTSIMGAVRGFIDKAKQAIYGASIAESMAKARTAGQAQAQSYGEFLAAVTAELRACGVPEAELKKVTDQAWRDAALASCRNKAAAAAPSGLGPLGWIAILGGVAAVGGGTYYLLKRK